MITILFFFGRQGKGRASEGHRPAGERRNRHRSGAKICVVPSEQYGDRYACVKVEVSREKPVRYELGMVGNEDLDEELGRGRVFWLWRRRRDGLCRGHPDPGGLQGILGQAFEEDPDIDPYNDLFCDLLEENAKAYPKDQPCRSYGGWVTAVIRWQAIPAAAGLQAAATG